MPNVSSKYSLYEFEVYPALAPELAIALSGTNVVITWPTSATSWSLHTDSARVGIARHRFFRQRPDLWDAGRGVNQKDRRADHSADRSAIQLVNVPQFQL